MLLWFWQRNPSSSWIPWLMWLVNFLGLFLCLCGSLTETVGYVGQLLEMSLCFRSQVKELYNFHIFRDSVHIRIATAFASIKKSKVRHKCGFFQQGLICVAFYWKMVFQWCSMVSLISDAGTDMKYHLNASYHLFIQGLATMSLQPHVLLLYLDPPK